MKYLRLVLPLAAAISLSSVYAQTPAASDNTDLVADNTTTATPDNSATATPTAKPSPVAPVRELEDILVVDTLPTINSAVKIVLFNDNTWRYVRDREIVQDSTVYAKYWNTEAISPYREVPLSDLPKSVAIALVDSLKNYHYPYKGKMSSRYGPRRRRNHNGVDLPLKEGDPIYATFDGRVRFSQDTKTGYGNLVIIRHDNGLETYMGHLSERKVEAGQWVTAGQVIGLGGNTGRSTGPHLHFEVRYYGQSFDPERLIDFSSGLLRRETFLLKRSYFDIYSKYDQNFDDEIANEEDDKREAAEAAARRYYVVRKGDTLSGIAVKYHTTVTRICQLNGISRNKTLSIGKRLRVL
ncbi:MAG: peptidoglycan DD-metalloendopeptidase family protein [Alistipes sp.]|nr:peptidoglycan DD-metalloendopeptidase family protein [Alistipes sp.]